MRGYLTIAERQRLERRKKALCWLSFLSLAAGCVLFVDLFFVRLI